MNSQNGPEERTSKIDWFALLRTHGRDVFIAAASAAAVVAVVGAAYVRWGQSTMMVASLEFRPTFLGIAVMRYPNALPFSETDVTAGPILDLVFDNNNLEPVCGREAFRGGFFVEQRSDQSVFLDLEYQARLTEPRITMVERKLLQEEHAAKRKALPVQYRLVFVTPASCAALAPVVLQKAMVEVLSTWASESETKRGVLNYQVEVLTPATLEVAAAASGGLLLRADLLRTALNRVIDNIKAVGRIPGATLIRVGPNRFTFAEVQGKLDDLVESRLDPLVMTSGRSMASESVVWVTETIAAAERKQQGAEMRAVAQERALSAFSGASAVAETGRAAVAAGAPSGSSSQALLPFDGTFIDRIVQMSDANARFRQKLTEEMVKARLEAVAEQQRASYYKRLLQSYRGPGPATESSELAGRLDEIVVEGKTLTEQFGKLYDELSRVSLRSAAALYETEKPVTVSRIQRFSNRSVLKFAGATFVGTILLMLAFWLLRHRLNLVPR